MLGSEIVRTSIFSVRNMEKTKEGHIGRAAVTLGQTKSVFDAVKELDCGLAKSAQSASAALHSACKKDVLVDGFYKVADKCSHNINPLIWASAGLDVMFAENKKDALVENVSAIGTMRITEELMKKHLDKNVDKLLLKLKETNLAKKVADNTVVKSVAKKAESKIASSNSRLLKMITKGGAPALIKGALFVVGSCLAYDIGRNFADNVLLGKKKES